jgi:hypothetical protein
MSENMRWEVVGNELIIRVPITPDMVDTAEATKSGKSVRLLDVGTIKLPLVVRDMALRFCLSIYGKPV